MGVVKAIRARLRALFKSREADTDLRAEIAFHIELETEKNVRLGMSRAGARRLAIAHFGGVERVREEHRDVRRLQWIDDLFADARFALRSMRRTPALTGASIITLAMGIGANVAIFSAVNAVVLRPLPFPNSDRLVMIAEENPEKRWHLEMSAPANYLDWRGSVSDFEDVMAYAGYIGRVTLAGRGEPRLLSTSFVTGNFFSTLGVRPLLGRAFTDEETWANGTHIVVLSERAFREEFAGDSSVIGKTIRLDGQPTRVVGVMPGSFEFPESKVDLWTPIEWQPSNRADVSFRRAHWIRTVARLRRGATRKHANAQLQAVVDRLKHEYPATNKYMGASITPLHDFLVGDTRLPLLVLLTSVGLLLLIACANVGNLLLVQAAGRQREAALRLALGAARTRLVRQALTESLVLSVAGGACGLALGWVGTHALVRVQPAGMLRVQQFGVDSSVLVYIVAITLMSGLVFGVGPALWMRHRDPADALKEGGRGAANGRRSRRWANALVVTEVALALLMTVGAGLLVRSLWLIQRVDPGFDTRGVLAVQIGLSQQYDSVAKVETFMNQLVERSHAIPGVAASALVSTPPLVGSGYTSDYIAAGRPLDGYGTEVEHIIASPEYFATMKVRILRGRGFTGEDRRGSPSVVVINEALARSYFAGSDPLGQRIAFEKAPTAKTEWSTIIGVTADQHFDGLETAPKIGVIQSSMQEPTANGWLLLRTSGDPPSLVPAVRAIVHDLDPTLAISTVRTMEQIRAQSMARARFLTTLLLMFATIGLLLSIVGVYGVLAQASRNRTREMGIRIALGAQAKQVRWLLIRQGLALTVGGLLIGGTTALFATRAMRKLLFNVAPNDPATLIGVAVLLATTGIVASWLPAVRASRADPASALRSD